MRSDYEAEQQAKGYAGAGRSGARPQQEPQTFYKRGAYFQCKLCNEYTVHEADDTTCQNSRCPSNNRLKQQASSSSNYESKAPTRANCRICYTRLTAVDRRLAESQDGLCSLCHKKNAMKQRTQRAYAQPTVTNPSSA